MISLQAFRISVGLVQFKFKSFKPKNSTYVYNNGSYKGKNNSLIRGILGFNTKIILIFFLLGVNTNNNHSKARQESNNKYNHIINGNITKKGTLTLLTWNKGNGTFKNKRDDILLIIKRYRPDIFAIHEANFDLKGDMGFENYSIETNTLFKGHNKSRTIMLIKKGVPYKRRTDLENDFIASV